MAMKPACEGECDHFRCKALSVTTNPRSMPSRMNTIPGRKPDPAWERGIPTDDRGMPMLDEKGVAMGTKAHERRGHEIKERKRQLANTT